jgi:hypothetical protein
MCCVLLLLLLRLLDLPKSACVEQFAAASPSWTQSQKTLLRRGLSNGGMQADWLAGRSAIAIMLRLALLSSLTAWERSLTAPPPRLLIHALGRWQGSARPHCVEGCSSARVFQSVADGAAIVQPDRACSRITNSTCHSWSQPVLAKITVRTSLRKYTNGFSV